MEIRHLQSAVNETQKERIEDDRGRIEIQQKVTRSAILRTPKHSTNRESAPSLDFTSF